MSSLDRKQCSSCARNTDEIRLRETGKLRLFQATAFLNTESPVLMVSACSLMPQGLRGIDAGRARGRNIARNQRHHSQDGHGAQHSRGIEHAQAEKL